jgi:hypothetical protein
MPTSCSKQESRSIDSTWYLLGEYSLGELSLDPEKGDKSAAEIFSEILRELAIPIEDFENIEMILRSFAREALMHFRQGRLGFPGRVRIFCQKKMINQEVQGGWGYFVIERSRDASSLDSTEFQRLLDVFFYEERE